MPNRMQHTTNTHGLQDESKREEDGDGGDGDDDVPINQVEIMTELLVTMKGIQHLMDGSSTPRSSSKCSSKSGLFTASILLA